MSQEPKPDYVFFSMNGTAKCCLPVEIFDEWYLAVGTTRGNCSIFTLTSHTHAATVYEDGEQRQIVALAQTSDAHLVVHVRAFAIFIIKPGKFKKNLSFEVTRKISTRHYGFCGVTISASTLLLPDGVAQLKTVDGGAEETFEVNIDELKKCGSMTCFAPLTENILLVGFEKGTVAIVDICERRCIQKMDLFDELVVACALRNDYVAVSSVKSPFKMLRFQDEKLTNLHSIPYPASARGCGALCFSPCGKQLVSGYWDGSVRVHSVKTGSVRVVISLHSGLVNWLCWREVDRRRLLFVCSQDDTLSVWNLHNDP